MVRRCQGPVTEESIQGAGTSVRVRRRKTGAGEEREVEQSCKAHSDTLLQYQVRLTQFNSGGHSPEDLE